MLIRALHSFSLIVILGFTCKSFAAFENYPPFTPDVVPPECPVKNLSPQRPLDPEDFTISYFAEDLRIIISQVENGNRARLEDASGVIMVPAVPIEAFHIDSVESFDITRDGRLDFIITAAYWGNGFLGGSANSRTLFLSGEAGYRAFTFETFGADHEDYIWVPDDHLCLLIQLSMTGMGKGRDGKEHNYFVYSLLRFDGSEPEYDNEAIAGFPKWIMYTYKPNYSPTTLLRDDQKIEGFEELRALSTPKLVSPHDDAAEPSDPGDGSTSSRHP